MSFMVAMRLSKSHWSYREDAKRIPIIAMTANAFAEDKMRAKEAGMNEHIGKPVDGKLLVKVIHELVG